MTRAAGSSSGTDHTCIRLSAAPPPANPVPRRLAAFVSGTGLCRRLAGVEADEGIGRTPADQGGDERNEAQQAPQALRSDEYHAEDGEADNGPDHAIDCSDILGH